MRILTSLLFSLTLLASSSFAAWQSEGNFTFRPGDSILIKVFQGEKNTKILMDKTVRLDGTGHTKLANGKRVKIGYGNMRTALATIEEGYRDRTNILGLNVHAHIVKHNGRSVVSLVGEVKRPGHGSFTKDMNLADAIAAAGGFKSGAYKKRVTVFRGGKIIHVDCRDEDKAKACKLEAGDLVEVDISTLSF